MFAKASYDQAAQDILDGRGYGVVPFGWSDRRVARRVMAPFTDLINSPKERRQKLNATTSRPWGLMYPDGINTLTDNVKFYCHFWRGEVNDNSLDGLFAGVNALNVSALGACLFVAEALDKLCPEQKNTTGQGFLEAVTDMRMMRRHVLRLFRCQSKPKENDLAIYPHTDSSFFTIAIYQSDPGFWIGSRDHLCSPQSGRVLIFPGESMQGFTDGRIKASLHGAKSVGDKITRLSATFLAYNYSEKELKTFG